MLDRETTIRIERSFSGLVGPIPSSYSNLLMKKSRELR